MYREAIALSIRSRRPDFEVLIAPPWPLDGRAERFGPNVLVHDADEAGLPPALAGGGVMCRVRVLLADRVHATIEMDGTVFEIRDACLEDLFGALEEAEGQSLGDGGG